MSGAEIASWGHAIPAILTSALILLAPGLLVGWLARLRGIWLYAVAPAISATILSLASILLPFMGQRWSLVPIAIFTLIMGAIVVVLLRLLARGHVAPTERPAAWPAIVACGIGGLLLSTYTVLGVGDPQNISQTFDNIFHLNAIAEIAQSGSASPFTVGKIVAPDGDPSFYPDGWHALVQLVSQLSGVEIPVAINAFNLAVALTVWPAGIVVLTRQLAGARPTTTLAAGILSAAFPASPLALTFYGVLYPYFFGIALVPVLLAVVLNLLGVARESRVLPLPALILLGLGLVPGVALAHPGAMMGALALSVPIAIVACFAGWRNASIRGKIMRLLGLAVYGAVGLVLLYKLRPGVTWQPRLDKATALWQTLGLSVGGYGTPLVTAALLLIGLIVCVVRHKRTNVAAVGMWAVGAALFIVTASISFGLLRGVTGVWYGDLPRLAALYPIAVIPIAVIGFQWIAEQLGRLTRGSRGVLAALVILLLLGSQALAGYPAFLNNMRGSYAYTDTSPLISTDEHRLLNRLADEVPEDAVIAGSPWTGTSLAYAFAGRDVVLPHIFMKNPTREREVVMWQLKNGTPEVCKAAADLNVRYVLDFGTREVHGGRTKYPGLEGLDKAKNFKLIDQEGDAKLYEMVACG